MASRLTWRAKNGIARRKGCGPGGRSGVAQALRPMAVTGTWCFGRQGAQSANIRRTLGGRSHTNSV
eukprot:5096105-Heterocapsa_arctica.AAC.1